MKQIGGNLLPFDRRWQVSNRNPKTPVRRYELSVAPQPFRVLMIAFSSFSRICLFQKNFYVNAERQLHVMRETSSLILSKDMYDNFVSVLKKLAAVFPHEVPLHICDFQIFFSFTFLVSDPHLPPNTSCFKFYIC